MNKLLRVLTSIPFLTLLLVVAIVILVGGCQTVPPQRLLTDVREIPAPPIVIKEPCIAAKDIAPLPPSATPPSAGPVDTVIGLAIDATRLADIAKKQQAQLQSCAKLSNP